MRETAHNTGIFSINKCWTIEEKWSILKLSKLGKIIKIQEDKKMEQTNSISKKLIIFGMVIVCAVFIIGLYFHIQGSKTDDAPNTENAVQNVTDDAGEITTDTAVPTVRPNTTLPDNELVDTVRPSEILPVEPADDDGTITEIALTVMPEMPEPPELPETAYRERPEGDATPEDVAAHQALDPALTNPDVKPDGTPASQPVTNTPQPADNTPQGEPVIGETRYFPGFGWITYTGPNIGERSTSTGDWDKIIGSMN